MGLLPRRVSEIAELHLLPLVGFPLAVHAVTRGALRLPRSFRLLVHLGARDEGDERGPDCRNPHASLHTPSSAQRSLRTGSPARAATSMPAGGRSFGQIRTQ